MDELEEQEEQEDKSEKESEVKEQNEDNDNEDNENEENEEKKPKDLNLLKNAISEHYYTFQYPKDLYKRFIYITLYYIDI